MQIATWSLSRTQPNKRFDWYAKLLVRLFCPRSSSPGTPVLPSLQNPPFYPNATGLLVVVESNRIDLNFSVINLTTPFTEQASSRFTVSLRWMDFCSRSTVIKSVRDLKPNLPHYIKKKILTMQCVQSRTCILILAWPWQCCLCVHANRNVNFVMNATKQTVYIEPTALLLDLVFGSWLEITLKYFIVQPDCRVETKCLII